MATTSEPRRLVADAALRERARALRAEAQALLDGGVREVLSERLGEVTVAGSVALDLMAWRDLDLYARLEPADAPRLLGVVPALSEALARAGQPVSRVTFRDEHRERDPAFPDTPGLYLGVTTAGPAGGWKLDVWGWDAARHAGQRRRHAELAAMLARADRDLVLRLKDALWGRPGYRSMDIYAFALADAGTTLEDFERFQAELSAARGQPALPPLPTP
jgi:hypothetical protein